VDQIVAGGGRAKAYVDDVAKKVAAQNIINQVEDDFGQIDILINHAAVEPHIPLLDMDEWDWHRVLDVNLTGAFLMTQSAGRVMRERASGVIINLIHTPLAACYACNRVRWVAGARRHSSQACRPSRVYPSGCAN
jgi:NAD(P)-dependent dehydrogenase (short-subunit alcohol dehydrogenase family)